jgi:hypothetical protein
MSVNSIFNALNETKKKKNEDYNYEVTDTGNTEKVKEPGNKIDKEHQEMLKKKRKNSYKQNMETLDDETVEKEEEEKNKKVNTNVDDEIELSDDEVLKLKDILKALKVPESIETALEDKEFSTVYEFLEEEYGIKNEEKLSEQAEEEEQEGQEKQEKVVEKEEDKTSNKKKVNNSKSNKEKDNTLKLEEGVKLGVMEDGFATANTAKWDISLLVYEGGTDEVEFEAIELDEENNMVKLNMVFEDESVDREVYMEVDEMKKLLV